MPARAFAPALAPAVLAQLVLAAAALRHALFWGGDVAGMDLSTALNVAEALALLAYTALGAMAMLRAADLAGRGALSRRQIVAGGAVLATVAALSFPIASTDVYDYVTRGRVEALHGANPYTVPPESFSEDPGTADFGDWPHLVCPYGPLFTLLQTGVAGATAPLGPRVGPMVGVLVLSLMFAAAHTATGLLVGASRDAAAAPDAATRRLMVLWLWNPFVLLETCSSAHNEALVALGLAVTCLGIVRVQGLVVALAYGLAALVKHGIAPVGPFTLAWAVRRHRLPGYLAGVGLTGLLAAFFVQRYFLVDGGFDWIRRQAANLGGSLHAGAVAVFGRGIQDALLLGGQLLALAVVLVLAPRVRTAADFGRLASAGTLVFLLVAMPLFSPWYHLWWLPVLAACARPELAARGLTVAAWALPPVYVVFLATRSYGAAHQVWTFACGLALPCALLLPGLLRPDAVPRAD